MLTPPSILKGLEKEDRQEILSSTLCQIWAPELHDRIIIQTTLLQERIGVAATPQLTR